MPHAASRPRWRSLVAEPHNAAMTAPTKQRKNFVTTHWSVVIAAGESRKDALEQLCRWYWSPLYAFARRGGATADEALDLTQGFFARLLEKGDLAAANPARGRFRSWLLTAMKHYQTNQWVRDRAQKRGGNQRTLSLDGALAEDEYRKDPADHMTPERLYERRWAEQLARRAMDRLQEQQERLGNKALFERLRGFVEGDPPETTYAELAREFPKTDAGALKTRVSRLRKDFQELLRDEVAQTLDSTDDLDDELRHLIRSLGPDA